MAREKSAAGSAITIVLLLASVPVLAWSICTLWGWFVVPLGIKDIGWAGALGLSALFGVFKGLDPYLLDSSDNDYGALKRAVGHIINPPICVASGWIYLKLFS